MNRMKKKMQRKNGRNLVPSFSPMAGTTISSRMYIAKPARRLVSQSPFPVRT